jgi:hypothetical protein
MQNNEPNGVSKSLTSLGKGFGAAAALLGTPAVYGHTRMLLMSYYGDAWGMGVAKYATWATGLIEAYILYGSVELAFVGLVSWWIAKRASASFGT